MKYGIIIKQKTKNKSETNERNKTTESGKHQRHLEKRKTASTWEYWSGHHQTSGDERKTKISLG